jgi:hypothetical protein
MTTPNLNISLEEVIDEFFYSSDTPNVKKLQAAIDAHPEYREDLVDFAALWSSYENTPDLVEEFSPSMISDQSISTLQSFVLNRLHDLNNGAKGVVPDVGAAREALGKLVGNALRRAAAEIGLYGSSALLQKILNNGIQDVPCKVLENLALYLQITVDGLSGALTERGLGGAKSFKASEKPIVAQTETWANAVNMMSLSDEQKKALLALQDKE